MGETANDRALLGTGLKKKKKISETGKTGLMAACGRQRGTEPSASFIPQLTLSLPFQAVKKETIRKGQVSSAHSPSPELSRALIGDRRRTRLAQTVPAHPGTRSCQSELGSVR